MLLWDFGDYGLDAKSFELVRVSDLDTYISFIRVSFRCIGLVLGIPRGIIGTKSGRKIFFFFTLGQSIYTYTYTGQTVAPAL